MDEGDKQGYILDTILAFAKKHNIETGEDLFQMDEPQLDAVNLVDDLLEMAGVYDRET